MTEQNSNQSVPLNAKAMKRAWWSTPITLTAVLMAMFYTVAILIGVPGNGGLIAVGIALFLGLCGLGWGLGNSARARTLVSREMGAQFLPKDHALTMRVAALADRLEMPRPEVGVMVAANAFAVGTSPVNSAVIIGTPLIRGLSGPELDAVIGHEIGHIATRDVHRMQVAEGYQMMFGEMFAAFVVNLVRQFAKTNVGAELGFAVAKLGRVSLFLAGEIVV